MTRTRAPARALAAASLLLLGLAVLSGAATIATTERGLPSRSSELTLSRSAFPNVASRASATWCGTQSEVDARTNAVAGHPAHWVYAIPSDGQDRLASFGSVMQTDAELIDAWWRSQDATRAPRGDLARFSCGLQLDISSVRLPQSGAQLASAETPFDLIVSALVPRGFGSPVTKHVVYYDGPVGDTDICGVGAGSPNGLGIATVNLQSCAGIATSFVAAHELLHAMGAVPNGAPHNCPPPDDGHTCDTPSDVMYPSADETPLSALTLDPGRDDYYGHSGGWTDIQDSRWLVQLDRQAQLALTIAGPGRVVADIPGLDCSQSCSTTWNNGTPLVLTPAPNPGAKLVRWSGGCAGRSQCALTVAQGSAANALFAPVTYRLSVRISGRGAVRSAGSAIACPGRCTAAVVSHAAFRLTATPGKGWRLKSWTGACRGKGRVCTLPMTANTSARAVFVRV
ncbi:hypothetical protein BH09ACT13_BH09ACT13_12190 [soil metagenome]